MTVIVTDDDDDNDDDDDDDKNNIGNNVKCNAWQSESERSKPVSYNRR